MRPIFFFWNLCIEYRVIFTDILSLFFSYFCKFISIVAALGIIQNIKVYIVSFALCLC